MKKILYTPFELFTLIQEESPAIIDIRDPAAYELGHIPGAVNIPEIFDYLSMSDAHGIEDLQKTFQKLFSEAGINMDKQVVFYEESLDSRYGSSCRGYWLLTYLGHPDAAILDGGYIAWLEENLPETTKVPSPVPAVFSVHPKDSIIATKDEVIKAMRSANIIILDNRDADEWFGKSSSPYGINFAPRKGRIPGATWIEWYEFMDRTQKIPGFKPPSEIKKLCSDHGLFPDQEIIIYCFKGARAAHAYVAMLLAGFTKLRVYFASWNEWSRDSSLPLETESLIS